jgi:hypothetical protein
MRRACDASCANGASTRTSSSSAISIAARPCWIAIRGADAFLFASPTETQGLVLIEAMALGVPIVSTAVMGTATVLRDAASALVAPEDVEGFATQVTRVLRDAQLRALLSAAGPRDCASVEPRRADAARAHRLWRAQSGADHANHRGNRMTLHRSRWLPIVLLLTACVAWAAAPWVDLEKRFTTEQMHATGLDTLKPEQLALLNQLLRDEARDAAASAPPPVATVPAEKR